MNVREDRDVMVVMTLAGLQFSRDRGKSFKSAFAFGSRIAEVGTRGLARSAGFWLASVPATFSDRLMASRDGRQWEPVAAPPEAEHVYRVFQTPEGASSIAAVEGGFIVVGGIAATGKQPVLSVFRVTLEDDNLMGNS